jgi:hypothetical protein
MLFSIQFSRSGGTGRRSRLKICARLRTMCFGWESGMNSVVIATRRLTRFLLASFLWLHALFFWNPQTRILTVLSRYIHLTFSEVTLFVLLFLFSVLCSSGWWNTVKSAAYIYCFPFVLLGRFFVLLFLALKGINAWFKRDQPAEDGPTLAELVVLPNPAMVAQPAVSPAPAIPVEPAAKKSPTTLSILTRPFRHFTVLWCALLLFATHKLVLWLSFAVVLGVLALRIWAILKLTLFSRSWLEKIGAACYARLNVMLTMLAAVTPKTEVTKELRELWQQLGLWQGVSRFLANKYLLSRWASLLVGAFYVCIYAYIALLFSFVYFGIARVSGLSLPWSEAAVDSLFIPVYVTELPKTFFMRFAGGMQWTLIVVAGFGTFWNYFHRRLEAVHTSAMEIGRLLTDQAVHAKYKLLESKVNPSKTAAEPSAAPAKPIPAEPIPREPALNSEDLTFSDLMIQPSPNISVAGDLRPLWRVQGRIHNRSPYTIKSVRLLVHVWTKVERSDSAIFELKTEIPPGEVQSFGQDIHLSPPEGDWSWDCHTTSVEAA